LKNEKFVESSNKDVIRIQEYWKKVRLQKLRDRRAIYEKAKAEKDWVQGQGFTMKGGTQIGSANIPKSAKWIDEEISLIDTEIANVEGMSITQPFKGMKPENMLGFGQMKMGWADAGDDLASAASSGAKWNDDLLKTVFKNRSETESKLAGVTREIEGQQKAVDDLTDDFTKGHFVRKDIKDEPLIGDDIDVSDYAEGFVWRPSKSTVPLKRRITEKLFRVPEKERVTGVSKYGDDVHYTMGGANLKFSSSEFDNFLFKLFQEKKDPVSFYKKVFGEAPPKTKSTQVIDDIIEKMTPPPVGAEAPKSTAPQLILERLKEVTKTKQTKQQKTFAEKRQEVTQQGVAQFKRNWMQQYGSPELDFTYYYHMIKRPARFTAVLGSGGVASGAEMPKFVLPNVFGEEGGIGAQPDAPQPPTVPLKGDTSIATPVEVQELIQPQLVGDVGIQGIRQTPITGVDLSMRVMQGMDSLQALRMAELEAYRQAQKLREAQTRVTPVQAVEVFDTPYRPPPRIPIYPSGITIPIIPPFGASTRKPRRSRTMKRPKTAIWWNVPSQPLGEPWSPMEYLMAGRAGAPSESAYIQEQEAKRGLDTYKRGIFSSSGKGFDVIRSWRPDKASAKDKKKKKQKKAYDKKALKKQGEIDETVKKVTSLYKISSTDFSYGYQPSHQ
jgi:hypothetical protein